MGTPKLSSVRQGPSSNHQHHEGFHLPLPRGRRHGRGRSPVPLRQLRLQHLPQHLRLRRRLQPLHLRLQLLPLRQEGGRGRPRPDLRRRLPLPHRLQRTFPRSLQHPLHHPLGKREAEADPALVYSSGYHYPTVYSGIHNYGYSGLYNHGIYSGLHYGKRSADAEPKADAALIYSGLHYPSTYGYGLHNYGYSGLYNHGLYSGIHTYGKREAEAEPWRSYYGGYSGYGRGYGYSGYGGYGGYRGYRGWY